MPSSECEPGADRRTRLLLVAVALGCVVLMAVLYVLAVRTSWGQRIDETAVSHHRYDRTPIRDARRYDTGSIDALALIGLGVVAMGLPRWRTLSILTGSIGTAVILANVLRRAVLIRPSLGVFDMLYGPSYPSGHATAAVTIAMAALVLCPWRPWLRWALALLIAGSIDGLVIFIPIHRPSDVIGGNLLGLAVSCVALAVFAPHLRALGAAAEPSPVHRAAAFGAMGLVEAALLFGVMSRLAHRSNLSIRSYGVGFAFGLLVDVLSAAAVLATFAYLINRPPTASVDPVTTPSSAGGP